jgi:UDP-galactopyranose mutase
VTSPLPAYDLLIVGAGPTGSVIAHEANRIGLKVLVLDRRDHIAGNTFTRRSHGIDVHEYGAHIFHTSNSEVWSYVKQFSAFNNYVNAPLANYKGEIFNLPFNMNTFYKLFGTATPEAARARIEEETALYVDHEPNNLEEQALKLVGATVYHTLIKGYTEKQWGRQAKDIPAFIIKRIPLRFTFNNNYFNDPYQGIPVDGYTALFERMLEGIPVKLSTDYLLEREYWRSQAREVVFTGPIDAYFDFEFGDLAYRSLRFEHEHLPHVDNYQGNAVVNYTDAEVPYTRVLEHKHFNATPEAQGTWVTHEYSRAGGRNIEPYYPINDSVNQALYAKYKAKADREEGVHFIGRLAEYSYFDTDQVIGRALAFSRSHLRNEHP